MYHHQQQQAKRQQQIIRALPDGHERRRCGFGFIARTNPQTLRVLP